MTQFEADFAETVASLPELTPLKAIPFPGVSAGRTYLVTVLGFERRCLASAEALATRGWKVDGTFCIEYGQAEMREANFKFRMDMEAILRSLLRDDGINVRVSYDDHEFGNDFGDILTKTFAQNGIELSSSTHVIFDITVGSSRLLLESLHALLTEDIELSILYAEASDYRPLFEEYISYVDERRNSQVSTPEFLARGVDHVEILKRISGQAADSRPTYLIAVPSFTPIRIDAAIEELSPSRVHWVFGIPHLIRNRWRLDAQRAYHEHLIQRPHRTCYISTFDYRETLIAFEAIYRKRRSDYTLLVCSLGSKMQKLGQSLFHILRPEVAAAVSVPRTWEPERYSSVPRAIYSVQLGSCTLLKRLLWKTRMLRI